MCSAPSPSLVARSERSLVAGPSSSFVSFPGRPGEFEGKLTPGNPPAFEQESGWRRGWPNVARSVRGASRRFRLWSFSTSLAGARQRKSLEHFKLQASTVSWVSREDRAPDSPLCPSRYEGRARYCCAACLPCRTLLQVPKIRPCCLAFRSCTPSPAPFLVQGQRQPEFRQLATGSPLYFFSSS